jgi:hypothetical protein
MAENKHSSISNATNLDDMGAFWDTHDFTDHDSEGADITVAFHRAIAIEPQLFAAIEQEARTRGVTVETLVNLWLQQRLSAIPPKIAA